MLILVFDFVSIIFYGSHDAVNALINVTVSIDNNYLKWNCFCVEFYCLRKCTLYFNLFSLTLKTKILGNVFRFDCVSGSLSVCKKWSNMELFLVRIFPYLDWINTSDLLVIFVEINALKLCLYEYSLHVHLVDTFSAPSFGYQLLN